MGSVKLAEASDMPELLRMGKSFHEESGYSKFSEFNYGDMESVFINMIENGTLITDGISGMLGFVVFPLFFDQSKTISQELFWWVDKESRGCGLAKEMLQLAQRISEEKGVSAIIMLNIEQLNGSSVEKMYLKNGYVKAESSFMRII